MSERGERTVLEFGGVEAEVSLLKTSGSPREARHEVRRGDAPGPWAKKAEAAAMEGGDDEHGSLEAMVKDSPLGASAKAQAATPTEDDEMRRWVPPEGSGDPEPEGLADPDPVQHGVWVGEGEQEEWIDLTERLEEIDANTKLKGMSVVCTIPSASVPRDRVRGARWISSTGGPDGARVLALLWHGLRATGRVAVVRRTVRTNQALGIVVARTLKTGTRALLVLELEWAENMRPAGPRVTAPIEAEVSVSEQESAQRLVEAFAESPAALDALVDERAAKRAELLAAARHGLLEAYEPPPPPPEAEAPADLAAQLDAAASR